MLIYYRRIHMRANSVVEQSTNGTLSSTKSRIFRTCEGYVRSKALDLEGNDYDN